MTPFFKPLGGNKENRATWNSYDGKHAKQIDYIPIGKRYRNWVKNICNKGNANILSPTQRKVIIDKIKIKLKKILYKN